MSGASRLVLHIGMPKTGSSALQVAFVRNRDWLARSGIYYPTHYNDDKALKGGVVSGNGIGAHLYTMAAGGLRGKDRPSARVFADPLEKSPAESVLMSSEGFWGFLPGENRFRELQDIVSAAGAELHIAVFVRNVVGHALSAYSQRVKRAKYTESFDSFIRVNPNNGSSAYSHPMRKKIDHLLNVVGPEKLHVLHYDSSSSRITTHFLRTVFGIDDFTGFAEAKSRINRSLTPDEIDIMRRLNRHVERGGDATRLSDEIISMPEFGDRKLRITPQNQEILSERFSSDIEWINRTFFAGEDVVGIGSDKVTVTEDTPAAVGPARREKFYLGLIGKLAPYLKS
ncbi:hypothetical protein [Brevibacterium litoralis]|uniref:hypothetical protein n=1 Tax=Brevibacterium litoralis TaxID=3138935 RepID=UPI0032EE8C1B